MKKRDRFLSLVQGAIDDGDYRATVIIHIPVPRPGGGGPFAWHQNCRGSLAAAMHTEGYEEIAYAWYKHGRGADIAFGSNDDDDVANVIPETVQTLMAGMYPKKPDPALIAQGFKAVFGILSMIPGPVGAVGAVGSGIVSAVEGIAEAAQADAGDDPSS